VFAGFDFQDFNPTNDLRGSFSSLVIHANNIEKSAASYAIPEKAKITVVTISITNSLGGYQLRNCTSFDQDESPAGVSANGTLTINTFNTRRVEGHFSVDLDCSYGLVAFGDSPGDISYEQSRLLSGSFSSALLPPEGEFSF
jgi:plastocyanin domain-containing protein